MSQVTRRKRVDAHVRRILSRLRTVISDQGFTQLEVQDQLEWGRSYISQLLTGQKSIRVDVMLLILDVVEVKPAEFFAEVFEAEERAADVEDLRVRLDRLTSVLTRKGVVTLADLAPKRSTD